MENACLEGMDLHPKQENSDEMGALKMCVLIMKTNNIIPHIFILAFCIEPQATRCIILSSAEH